MIATRPFGRTGHQSTRLLFGAAGIGWIDPGRLDGVFDVLAASDINHIDTAAGYGEAEVRLRPFLAAHRGEYFLATKTGERDGDGARAELERSLDRMDVDHVDLIQLHNLVEPDEWDAAFAPGGAVDALARARDEGLARAIGVTGHGLRIAAMHRRSLERFDFDSVLLPYNHAVLADADYRREVEALLATCADRDVAVQAIKSVARRRWQDPGAAHSSWYEPLPEGDALARAVAYVWSNEQLFINASSDVSLLPAMIAAAERPGPPPTEEQLDADADALGVTPLFDGGELERI
jgi:aryl-alcohol dehydrogenase-like predicted oxidoreductase